MIRVSKIGHASFETGDLGRQVAYYTDVLGLTLIGQEKDTAYLASTLDRQSVVLRKGGEVGCTRLAFQLPPGTDLADYAKQLSGHGVTSEHRTDPEPGLAACLTFKDDKGTWIDVYAEQDMGGQRFADKGIVPFKLGHVAFNVQDIQRTVAFYRDVLGFRESDWMGDFFAFLRCGPDHHTVNFVKSERSKMHHIAFELKDWAHVQAACDFLSRSGLKLLWGPGRHGVGHNIYTYHHNPDGQIVELFTELDRMASEELGYYEPRPWHEDRPQRPKTWVPGPGAANLWGLPPPEGFLA